MHEAYSSTYFLKVLPNR